MRKRIIVPVEKLKELVGQSIIVKYVWIGIEKVASGILISASKKKIVVDHNPFSYSFFGRINISFENNNTKIKQITTTKGENVYLN